MIDQIKGILEKKSSSYAVVFVGGVGFKIRMSINCLESLPVIGNKVKFLTYLHVREDILNLYGFIDDFERNTFHLLISISGIGPKLALTILSGIRPDKLKEMIIAGDVVSLTSIPGVGTKTAKRIIIELKEKFINSNDVELGFNEVDPSNQLYSDVINALIALGYKHNHAQNACLILQKKGELKGALESVIKKALKELVPL